MANEVGIGANEVGIGANAEDKALYRLFLDRLGWQGAVKDTENGLSLGAKTIKPLHALLPIDYGQAERLILHLGLQMQVLQEQQQGICGFTLEDVTVLDGKFFFLSGLQQVISMKKDSILSFTYPLKFSEAAKELLAPELREKLAVKVLPFTTTISVGYYSLAKLCLECLDLTDKVEVLRGSKMYYCFERCLRTEPAARAFLYF
jgi:hypothetical protein